MSIGECMIEFARTADSNSWLRNFAGDTFNTAWYFNKLTRDDWQTAYFTAIGDDRVSDEMCAFIEAARIGTGHIRRIAGKSPGLYTIDLDGAERSFCYWRENSAAKRLADDADAMSVALASATEIYFSGITLAILDDLGRTRLLDALRSAKEAGKSVSFDPNIRPRLWNNESEMKGWVERAAAVSTRAFPTFPDEAGLFGDNGLAGTAQRYRSCGVAEVVVKNGAEPCFATHGQEAVTVPAQKVEHPVDTTGAGDSFNGAYLAARVAGKPLAEACDQAHRVSARVVSSFGALLAPASIAEIETWYG
ncbi:MAG: sugar kinase [Alphaproteobacteria bacterium]|nr:sugar kinase [Alphaproteobacteria bacterium]